MSQARDLLVEIGTEELPPKALHHLSEAFGRELAKGLDQANLDHGALHNYATPRRLAVWVTGLAVAQPDRTVERRGPAVTAAFDEEGCPTKAAVGFARSCGIEVEALETLETDKGSWLVYRSHEHGRPTRELLPEIVREALDRLPIPRRMRWSDRRSEFVRPVHWAVLLLDDHVIEAEILGVAAGRETRGHRFHRPQPIYVAEPAAYGPLLETEGHVVADFEARAKAIRGQVAEAARAAGGRAVIDADLLEEVTAMVEWPVAVLGEFDRRFLEVPPEAVTSAMKTHQKYFPVVDEGDRLLPYFVAVSNIESREPEVVRAGNERVIRPRLADADFFWNQDRKQRLDRRVDSLRSVVFQRKLGTLYDKGRRMMGLAGDVARRIGAERDLAQRAAELCKCDLMTEMVGEFPELQGIMGRYYAAHDGEPEEVSRAIDEHYRPRYAGDVPPETLTGQAVAIADKADTLVGLFGIRQPPSGEKDPFALRRAALGLVRTIIERELELDLVGVLQAACAAYAGQEGLRDYFASPSTREEVVQEVFGFVMDRLRGYYEDQGIAHDVFEAVRAQTPPEPLDFDARVRAVAAFRDLPEAECLAAANKRISNILRQAEGPIGGEIDGRLLEEDAERLLAERLSASEQALEPLFEVNDYTSAMRQLAALREPLDGFFDCVMVMTEDAAVRRNRLAVLSRLRSLFLRIADLSRLH
ncbi:MAG: glycine--tRNA ligase subunit beta [Gammaproteobacteria bacterium]|nr:glycine--tRNA ligase subunit beta [Gammaproteobacteria bacterium]NIR98083.1 glycine--tRNA ligase subunit beta [Gammaproteobacteria bacterium]NIT63421.1 glycine--tRNA ligase subunit beta [Gammaproteobacteria bacterium]NIV20328.1 glycine--tRNA ligase subunit beta [Gammaproteobacteria bacterium]NIX10805.1 glycine--tRNA ligase subunit beta [Gammaproteobacteria bacterium]